jgi:GT2 family glycosyltransferase
LLPTISVIIPAYNSHETIAGCLNALRQQTFLDFECIVVDSGPSHRSQEIVQANFPEVRFFRSAVQLPPQAARDYGAAYAQGTVLVFTDPDIYPAADWLERMVAAHAQHGNVIVGAIDCYGHQWLDVGIHLCKFYKCLPGPTSIDVSPSGNMLCTRSVFEKMGGFNTFDTQGDVLLSWRVMDHGYTLHFVPDAIVYHHHTMTWSAFLKERYIRGKGYAALRTAKEKWNYAQVLGYSLITVMPLRLASLICKGAVNAWRADRLSDALWTMPVIVAGQALWLAGEATYFAERLLQKKV